MRLEPTCWNLPDTPPPSSSSALSPPSVTTCPLPTSPSEEFTFVSSFSPFLFPFYFSLRDLSLENKCLTRTWEKLVRCVRFPEEI